MSTPNLPTAPKGIRVAIVEDDRRVRNYLAVLIQGTADFSCVAACSSTEEALQSLPPARPEVVLMDLHLPGKNGVFCVAELRKRLPKTQIIMFTIEENGERIFECLEAGATGYLVKHTAPLEILEAIKEVHGGGAPMSSNIARKVVTAFRRPFKNGKDNVPLAPREEQVLQLLARGHRTKEIAEKLGVGTSTIQTYVRHIYDKLHVRSRAQAVAKLRG